MNKVVNLKAVSNYLQTKYDVNQVLASLDKVLAEMFKGNKKMADILDRDVPFPLSKDFKELAKEHGIDIENDPEADKFYGEVRKAIMNLPILTIATGGAPTIGLVKEINSWVIANIKGFVAIDLVVDHSLIAGAKISFNGRARDYSIKKQTLGPGTIQSVEIG